MRGLSLFGPRTNALDAHFENLFNRLWEGHLPADADPAAFSPRMDVKETEGAYLISADLPGVSSNDTQLEVKEGRLTLTGERKQESDKHEGQWHRVEKSYGRFTRSFLLPQNVDEENIQARFENGVLEVLLPKLEAAKAKNIKIETGKSSGLFSKVLGRKDESPSS